MLAEKALLTNLLIVISIIPSSRNAHLSIYEQKKYKNFLEGQGLYTADDDVEVLTVHNFQNEIIGAKHAWLIEFYNSWCGFCQRFAPSWKALGTDVKPWSDIIRIGAMDCSDDDNIKICRDFEIMRYPTLRYFPENYQITQKDFGFDVEKGDDVYSHKQNLIKRMIVEQNKGRGDIFPNLQPFEQSHISQLSNLISQNQAVKYIFLIIEQVDTLLGAEIALDFHHISSLIIRYSFHNNTELINNLKVTKFPSLVIIGREIEMKILSDGLKNKESLRMAIKLFLEPKKIDVPIIETKSKEIFTGKWRDAEVPDMNTFMQERAKQALKDRIKKMGDVVFQMDLETTLRYSIKHEIATIKSFSGEKLDALKSYLDILAKYFPFGHKGQLFLNIMQDMVGYSAKNKGNLEGSVFTDLMKNAEMDESQVFSSSQQWLACKGSSSSYRGYPCGLWKMFHYLTVNAAERNIHNKSANPREILETMHGYIKNFFGCADCSKHFQEMALKRDLKNVSSFDSSILWLWMAHNEVNKRLAGDETEDPDYPKYQFPSKQNCNQCRSSDNSWNLVEVLRYLKHMYSSINVRYIGSDTRVLHVGLEGYSANSDYGNIFKTLDMSLCLILYVSSFVLLVVLIRIFLKRGYKKKLYVHDLLGKV